MERIYVIGVLAENESDFRLYQTKNAHENKKLIPLVGIVNIMGYLFDSIVETNKAKNNSNFEQIKILANDRKR